MPHSETDSIHEYFDRLHERRCASSNREALQCCLWKITRSADRHLARFDLAARRHQRALELNDRPAMAFERETMLALLYEAADTVYLILQMFDLERFELTSSSDGAGIAGEDAPFIREVLDSLERICTRVLENAGRYHFTLDFSHAVDEREHITYETHAHWRDLVPGSIDRSFYAYFAQARHGVLERLNQTPHFWHGQTLKQALMKSPRTALRTLVQRLMLASIPQSTLSSRIEKEHTSSTQRHLGQGASVQPLAFWHRETAARSAH